MSKFQRRQISKPNSKLSYIFKIILNFSLLTFHFVLFTPPLYAQSLSLSLSPPLVELMIQPDKTVTFSYQLINNSEHDQTITPLLKSFAPSGPEGLISFKEIPKGNPIIIDLEGNNKLNQPFVLSVGETRHLVLKIKTNPNTPEKDYYFTLLFSSGDLADKTDTQVGSITQIGSNLLITVSKDGQPNVTAEIKEFNLPKIIDSFDPITTNLIIANPGNVLFKPFGNILFSGWFNQKKEIKLIEQNVLSGSARRFNIEKFRPNLPIGKYTAKVEFQPNQQLPATNLSYTFYYFPIRLTLGIFGLLVINKIRRIFIKKKSQTISQ